MAFERCTRARASWASATRPRSDCSNASRICARRRSWCGSIAFGTSPRFRELARCSSRRLRSSVPFDLAVHFDVVAGAKAQRLAARAVHRVRSDDVTSSAAGFRRTARSSRNYERLAQREVRRRRRKKSLAPRGLSRRSWRLARRGAASERRSCGEALTTRGCASSAVAVDSSAGTSRSCPGGRAGEAVDALGDVKRSREPAPSRARRGDRAFGRAARRRAVRLVLRARRL